MFCTLWLILHTFTAVVQAGVSSGSAEAVAGGGLNNNGAAAGNKANPQNGVPLNTEALLARLLQLGGSVIVQPVGNQVSQQLIPIGALQQAGAFLVGQPGGTNANAQGQVAQFASGGPVTVLALVPQGPAGGDPQSALLTPGHVQVISLTGPNNQHQQQPRPAGGQVAGRLRFQRSVAARLRRTQPQPPTVKVMATEEEEECSGTETEDNQTY